MYNKVILIGNIGKDPEVRHLEGGIVVAKFPIATNESYKDSSGEWQTKTEWHDIVVWRHLAEKAEKDFKKGMLVFVEGKVTHRKWQNNEGENRYSTEIVASSARKLERSDRQNNMPGVEDAPEQNRNIDNPTYEKDESQTMPGANDEPDDLPF